jgi:hypothetical protein
MTELDREIDAFVHATPSARDEERFDALALRLFERLLGESPRYRAYCERSGLDLRTVTRWDEIPAIAFHPLRKLLAAAPGPPAGCARSGRHGVVETERRLHPLLPDRSARAVSVAANELLVRQLVFPDVDRMELLLLVPPPFMAPGMVMARDLAGMKPRFGTPESRFLISFGGFALGALVTSLRRAERTGRPVAIVGATFVLDRFLDACRTQGVRFELPRGSRVIDSGGFTARYIGCTQEELLEKCRSVLGVPGTHCVNALWLCESSTIYFDDTLRLAHSGVSAPRCKEAPRWTRVTVVDPRTLERVPQGQVGLLRLHDLTNRQMAFAVLTDKLALEAEGGFEVLGNWNRDLDACEVDRAPQHPGGRAATAAMDRLLRRQLSRVGALAGHA